MSDDPQDPDNRFPDRPVPIVEKGGFMADDPNQPVVLMWVPTETEAAIIVAALASHGVLAHTVGGMTSGGRIGLGPDYGLQILVRQDDLERARDALPSKETD